MLEQLVQAQLLGAPAQVEQRVLDHDRLSEVGEDRLQALLHPPQIAELYDELARLTGSPVIELNRAVAIAEAQGPARGLEAMNALELDNYQYLHAARADLLRRLGRLTEARSAYERALELVRSEPEQRFLEGRLAQLGD